MGQCKSKLPDIELSSDSSSDGDNGTNAKRCTPTTKKKVVNNNHLAPSYKTAKGNSRTSKKTKAAKDDDNTRLLLSNKKKKAKDDDNTRLLLSNNTKVWVNGILPFLGPGQHAYVAGVSKSFRYMYIEYFSKLTEDKIPIVQYEPNGNKTKATFTDTFHTAVYTSVPRALFYLDSVRRTEQGEERNKDGGADAHYNSELNRIIHSSVALMAYTKLKRNPEVHKLWESIVANGYTTLKREPNGNQEDEIPTAHAMIEVEDSTNTKIKQKNGNQVEQGKLCRGASPIDADSTCNNNTKTKPLTKKQKARRMWEAIEANGKTEFLKLGSPTDEQKLLGKVIEAEQQVIEEADGGVCLEPTTCWENHPYFEYYTSNINSNNNMNDAYYNIGYQNMHPQITMMTHQREGHMPPQAPMMGHHQHTPPFWGNPLNYNIHNCYHNGYYHDRNKHYSYNQNRHDDNYGRRHKNNESNCSLFTQIDQDDADIIYLFG